MSQSRPSYLSRHIQTPSTLYLKVLEFPDNPPRSSWYLDVGPGIARRVFMQNTRQGPVGLVVHPVSQWFREYADGCWESVLLLDAPLEESASPSRWSTWSETLGSFSPIQDNLGSKQSLLVPLMNHLHTYRAPLWALAPQGVGTSCSLRMACIMLEKFVLSNWQQTLSFLQYDAETLDLLHLSADDSANYDAAVLKLEMFRFLAAMCCLVMQRNLHQLAINPTDEIYYYWKLQESANSRTGSGSPDSNLMIPINVSDWFFIFKQLHILKEYVQQQVDSHLAALKMCEDKRRQSESQHLGLMTLLLAVFVPMSFSTGLFSMTEDFTAGKPKFWIYWYFRLAELMNRAYYWWLARVRWWRLNSFSWASENLEDLELGVELGTVGELSAYAVED
ncbi:hypothetical protein EDB81DRAFT_850130 [Dactylonectria macrodidyma]|uniref:Uncharacterized protein n=1 Tax=Dactylonectria macrodidyma TaxID=307937 RepID=A0A9P9FUB2_9HYPO|nr:hypothetical protein EDB81DRAFT_850130 [Dactylonectria macrodidyma]